jgi:hypothetical protein
MLKTHFFLLQDNQLNRESDQIHTDIFQEADLWSPKNLNLAVYILAVTTEQFICGS